jgi:hypothetical protein
LRIKIVPLPAASAAIISAGLLLGYLNRAIFPMYAIIFLSFFLISLARFTKRDGWVLHNLAFVFLALAIGELYFGFNTVNDSAAYPHLVETQDSLGYVGRRGTLRAIKTYGFGTGIVYDVHYSMPNGQRIAPDSLKQSGPTVMFFGDSFTFGDGVNDEDTLPNAFSIVSGMRVLNFGLSGYGPHHMLRLLELGIPKENTSSLPHLMVYTALEDHIRRAAGHLGFDKNGPLYEVKNGSAHYVGSFSEHNMACVPNVPRVSVVERLLNHSEIWQAYTRINLNDCSESNDQDTLRRDRTRFLEIVKAANVIAQQQYQSRLVVVLWDAYPMGDTGMKNINWIKTKLLESNIPTLYLSTATKESDLENWIIKRDGHPNPQAYRWVAQRLQLWLK